MSSGRRNRCSPLWHALLILLSAASCSASRHGPSLQQSSDVQQHGVHISRSMLQAAANARGADGVQAGVAANTNEIEELMRQLDNFRLRDSDLNVAFMPKWVYPIERGICGNWMDKYAQLHRDILQGRRPPRYSIFRAIENGLTDRLISTVTVFLHALLTDRAFVFDWHGAHDLWSAFRSSYVDWRYDAPEKKVPEQQVLTLNIIGDHRSPEHAEYMRWFTQSQLEDVGNNATHLIWLVNRGLVWKATHNPYLKKRLLSMGLSPINIFGCLFDFLYRPTPRTMGLMRPILPQLLDPSTFKVGLQIRTGDEHLGGSKKHKTFADAFEFFHCGKVAERHWKPPGQKSQWFLLTDSAVVRREASQYLGDKLLTMQDALVQHTRFIPQEQMDRSMDVLGFAAGETWLFSLADVHIISALSGFGRMGAFISCNWDSMIQLQAGMWSLSGYEANLTYVVNDGEANKYAPNRTVIERSKCKEPSRTSGDAFCWPEDPAEPPPLDGNSPMSVKIMHMCAKPTPMEDIVSIHTGG